MGRNLKITLAYDGAEFHGWQVQPGLPTIQGTLEQVLSKIEGKQVQVAGSGRTDAGVHALAQVAAFTIENPIPAANLVREARGPSSPYSSKISCMTMSAASLGLKPRFTKL